MKPKNKIIIIFAVLIFLVIAFYFASMIITKYTGFVSIAERTNNYDEFAKCLSSKEVKMYGAFWCSHCQNQKEAFGTSFQFIDYIECDPRGENSQTQLCLDKKIQGYPTWEIDNKLYPGEMSFEKISELSGCKLN